LLMISTQHSGTLLRKNKQMLLQMLLLHTSTALARGYPTSACMRTVTFKLTVAYLMPLTSAGQHCVLCVIHTLVISKLWCA
jgi:hypothetical protein